MYLKCRTKPDKTHAVSCLEESQQRQKSLMEDEYKRNETMLHSLVVLVFHRLESLVKLACAVKLTTL